MNLFTLLDMAADSFGDRVAIVSDDATICFGELRDLARAAAEIFQKSGAAFVVYLDAASPAAPVALFGAALAGIPYAPINYRLTEAEIAGLLARVAPGFVIAGEVHGPALATAKATAVTTDAFLAQLRNAGARNKPMPISEDGLLVAIQLFTSGTTGAPKAAILRHQNLCTYIFDTVEYGSADAADATLIAVPPYHVAGIAAVLSSVYAARRMVLLANFEAAMWLDLARRHAVSSAFLVPTMLQRIVTHLDQAECEPGLPALRAIAYGGGRMPLAAISRAMSLFPTVDFTNAYGLTETSSTICVLGPEDHRRAKHAATAPEKRLLASVGRPIPTVELQVRNEVGAVLGPGAAGNIFVRGGQVAGEYRGVGNILDPDGWFSTHDRGWLDEAGYLFLDGRADDVIVRGGENISPGEIEDVLLDHPNVADAVVVGVPDPEWGEAVAAAVVLAADGLASEAALQAWVKQRLRSSRVPQWIEFRAALPYNETGKVLRRVVRQEFEADQRTEKARHCKDKTGGEAPPQTPSIF